jgi:hypothetical protein
MGTSVVAEVFAPIAAFLGDQALMSDIAAES